MVLLPIVGCIAALSCGDRIAIYGHLEAVRRTRTTSEAGNRLVPKQLIPFIVGL